MYHIVSHEAHAEVAQMCMRYISVFLKQQPSRGNVAPLKSFPMLSYVLSSGFNHLAHVDPESTVVEALRSLGSDVHHHPSHWERLCELREEILQWPYPPWPSSRHDFVLYILIAYSSPALLQSFFSSGHPLKPRVGTNPLVYAADLRKTDHAMALLACGADMNTRGFVVDDSHHALPLEVAIDLGEEVLVGELLQRGCVVTSELLTTAVCMPWCTTRVLVKLMETGEFVEWAHEIGDERLYRNVFNSARPNGGDSTKTDENHVALARILRRMGQDLSADSPFGTKLIGRAVDAAHTSLLEFLLPPNQPPPPRFLLAASTGNTSETVSVVRFLLRKGVDLQAVSDGGRDTALHLAARCPWEPRSFELTKMLIDAGCSPYACNVRGETPLTIAVKRGHSSVAELLLSCNVPLPSDILHLALERGRNPQMIQLLILRGANVHAISDLTGNTVLHHAVVEHQLYEDEEEDEEDNVHEYEESECLDLVKRFIEAGCNPSTSNSDGETVLEVAIGRGYTSVVECLLSSNIPFPPNILPIALRQWSSLQMIQFLIRKGADVHSITSDGDTVLHLAIAEPVESRRLGLMKTFIEAGCNSGTCNSEGRTVLELAIERGYTSVVECLLSCSIPFPPDILLIALQRRSTLQMIQFLVQNGADVHSITSDGDTVLHLTIAEPVESRRLGLMKTFIEAGCNPSTCNSEGRTVLELTIERGYTSVVECLLSCNVPFPPDILLVALQRRSTPQMIQFLVRNGANIHSTTSDGDTVLHLAVAEYIEGPCRELAKSFIEAGCNPSTCNSEGRTVLDAAIERGYISVVELLLSCNVSFPPDILLIRLRRHSALWMVEYLIRKGADVHSTTTNGDTVLHLAIAEPVELRRSSLVKMFIEAGCNPSTCNSEGRTVLELAIERGYISVVELLLSCSVTFPPDILPIALQQRSTLQMIQILICKGADVHSTTFNGDTVLHLAITEYYLEVICCDLVKSFIKAGCNPTACNSEGKTVLDAAIGRGYISVVELLFSCNVPFPPDILPIALRRRSTLQMIQFLIRKGTDVHSTASNGDTVLHLAIAEYVEGTCRELVESFIQAGCNPTTCNSKGETVLDAAIKRGHTSVVELLLWCNVPFPSDILPIMLRQNSTPQTIEFLIRKGADVHSTTSNGNTVLHLAITEYYLEVICCDLVKSFIKVGCNPTACNLEGKTVLEAAIERRYASVVELLLSCNVPTPPDILLIALRNRSTLQMIRLFLPRDSSNSHATMFGSHWDTILQLVHTSYSKQDCQQVINFLDAVRGIYAPYPSLGDETPVHVAKKPRLR